MGAWHPVGPQHLTAEKLALPELTHTQVTQCNIQNHRLQGSACCPGREPLADLGKTRDVESGSVPASLPHSSSHPQHTAFSNVYRKLLSSPSTCSQPAPNKLGLSTHCIRIPKHHKHFVAGKRIRGSYWS